MYIVYIVRCLIIVPSRSARFFSRVFFTGPSDPVWFATWGHCDPVWFATWGHCDPLSHSTLHANALNIKCEVY
jgi:hypothetical protein